MAGWLLLVPAHLLAGAIRKGSGASSVVDWLAAQAFGLGHMLFGGLLSALVVAAYQRLRPARLARFDLAAFALGAAVIGWIAVGPDWQNYVERIPSMNRVPPGLLGAISCAVLVTATLVGARLLARRFAPAALVLALALAFANHFFLELDYPGMHFIVGWSAALAATVGLAALDLPWLRSPRGPLVMAALAPVAIVSLLLRPSASAWRKLSEAPGAFMTPYISELVPELRAGYSDAAAGDEAWMRPRDGAAATRPTGLLEVPEDGIVLLLVLDALRADVVRRNETKIPLPNFERLRARSVEFTQARSVASSTVSAMTTLFCGRFYSQLQSRQDDTPRIPELLRKAGVAPFHIMPTRLLDPKNGATRGFDIVRLPELSPSKEVMPKLEPQLAKSKKGRHLLYVHWMDAHAPYDLAGSEGSPWEAYLREVALVDVRLGELMDMLERTGVADRTTLIVTADHGEAFGEHDTWEHGKTVYEELLRVPLLIAAPGKKARTVDAPVSLVDVGATILDLFGQPVPGNFMGESLLPLAYGNAERVSHPIAAEARHKLRAFYSTDNVKVVFDIGRKTTEVYQLATDPLEAKNLADAPEMQPHIQRAKRYFEAHEAKKK